MQTFQINDHLKARKFYLVGRGTTIFIPSQKTMGARLVLKDKGLEE